MNNSSPLGGSTLYTWLPACWFGELAPLGRKKEEGRAERRMKGRVHFLKVSSVSEPGGDVLKCIHLLPTTH